MSESPRGRVVGAHRIAAGAFRLTGLFAVWSVGWVVARLIAGGGSWWGPLHVFLVGAVLLAISGAAPLFSITWAASTPPGPRLVAAQRWTTAIGAGTVVVGVSETWDAVTIVGASLVGLGLVLLGVLLVGVFRRSLLRRFGLSGRFYLLALGCGVVGVVLGAVLGVGGGLGLDYLDARTAHMHLNLVGLVGFTIVGTLPTLLPTTARHRMVSGREAVVAFWLSIGAAVAMVVGIVVGPEAVGLGVGVAAIAALLVLAGIVGRLGLGLVLRSSLPGLLIASGTVWIVVWCTHQAVVLGGGAHTVFSRAIALGAGGVAMVLFGSLAYLIPVLVGPGKALGESFPVMHGGATLRVVVANAILVGLAAGVEAWVLSILAGGWLLDYAVRVGRVIAQGRRP